MGKIVKMIIWPPTHHSRTKSMTEKNEAVANALELLMINQNGIGAAIEELAKWIAERGSTDIANNAVTSLQVLDLNADGITSAIRLLRQEQQ
jgi:hypothetical protein